MHLIFHKYLIYTTFTKLHLVGERHLCAYTHIFTKWDKKELMFYEFLVLQEA